MIETLTASQTLLAVVLTGEALLLYFLSRQLRSVSARVSPAGALTINQLFRPGALAPRSVETALDGATVEIGAAAESGQGTLLFFTSPTCPISRQLLPALRSAARRERRWLRTVLVSDGGTKAAHEAFIREHRLGDFPYLLSENLGRAFAVGKLPYAILIGDDGRILALGIVNSREHLESLFEARDLRFGTIQDYVAETYGQAQADNA